MSKPRVLIVEDEKLIRWSLRQRLEEEGCEVDDVDHGKAGLDSLSEHTFDLLMLDYKLPDMTGLDVLRKVREKDQDVVVLMITAFSNIQDAVEAMRLGAWDYISKPFKMDALMITVHKALETTRLKRQVRDYRASMTAKFGFERLLGSCPQMLKLFDMIHEIATSGASTIFLRGESGTGKDVIAKTIHYNSDRANMPFVNITCTAMAESLLESELFGYERGAFTDAKTQKKGLMEVADGGTVFLDEIGDMPANLQAKLLRFLEEKSFRRVGGIHDIAVDVRIVAATNRDVEKLITDGTFREDLYYRLNIIPVYIPPLRERGDDIRVIAEHFVAGFAKEFRRNVTDITSEAIEKLKAYGWPGNVRELRNAAERAVLLCKHEVLTVDDFVLGSPSASNDVSKIQLPPGGIKLADVEERLVRQALRQVNNNQTQAAKLLGLSRDQLRYRMERYKLL